MKDIRFSIEEIKVVAFDVFSGPQVFEDSFAQQYHGAQLLVSALEAAAVSDLPGPGEDELAAASEPEEAPKKEDPGKFTGYGAKLKRETFARLTEARKKGVTLSTIIAASGGVLREEDLTAMLACKKVNFNLWEICADALSRLPESEEAPG